ncbi:MAG: choice-of-anchor J domain-containing protein [Alloprevotella sp.]|nr:choice-of-anchor J domain-containing protein [Alloprevotella sp.]
MKKHLFILAAASLALGLASCEDVPAPYSINSQHGGSDGGETTVLLRADFSSTLNPFTNYTTSGAGAWVIDYSTAKASGYDNSSKQTTAGTYYLVSPELTIPEGQDAHVTFDYILRYNKGDENQQLLIINAEDFNADNVTRGWNVLSQTWVEGSDWSTFSTADVQIPERYQGKTIRVALRYNTNAQSGSTWEVKNFRVQLGKGGSGGGSTDDGTVHQLPYTAAFTSSLEGWTNVTTSGAGAWRNAYSCATATGYNNQVNVAGTYYLVSPEVQLGTETAHVTYQYILRFNRGDENQQVLISDAYDSANPTAGWTLLKQKHTEGTDYTTFSTADITIPQAFAGKKVRFAMRFNCTNSNSGTWEVKNFTVQNGQGAQDAETASGGGTTDDGGLKTLPYTATFTTSLEGWTNYTTSGGGSWVNSYNCATATGYNNKVNVAGTYYLVSPEVQLTYEVIHASYEYILRFLRGDDNQQFLITDAFDASKPAEGWTPLPARHTEGVNYTDFAKVDVQIPQAFLGKTVRFALRFNCTSTESATWEVKNFTVQEGVAGQSTDDGSGSGGTQTDETIGTPDAPNGDFENWTNGLPNNWKSASTASNATLSMSTDARTGSYSVLVKGSTAGNQRLAYKELELAPDRYTISFWVKAESASGASVIPGYATVVEGKNPTYFYLKDASGKNLYINDLTNTDWTQITMEFSLNATTTLCPLLMVSKTPGLSVLVDDFKLMNANGAELIY